MFLINTTSESNNLSAVIYKRMGADVCQSLKEKGLKKIFLSSLLLDVLPFFSAPLQKVMLREQV